MGKRIERLTAAQEAMLPVYRDLWLAHGLSCEPSDLERCKAAATLVYQVAGLEPPKLLIMADGPISGAIIAAALRSAKGKPVWASVRDSVGDSVEDSVEDSVGDSVRASVWDSVWASVGASVGDSVGEMLFSSHDAGYLGWHDFFLSELKLPTSEPIRGLVELAKECGWWAPYAGAAIFQHRHCELHSDDRGRLHNEGGMAVKYRDGWGVWAIHGTRVTERVVMHPDSLTVADIKAEKNAEVRRVMRERFGDGHYLAETGAKLVDSDFEGARKGAAPRALLLDDEGQRWLVGTDGSTGRCYYMRAPSDAETCRQAHVALCGFDERKILCKS